MTGTIAHLFAAGLFLLLTHFGISSTPLRAALVGRLGEKPYLGLYSLVSALAFWWLVAAYNAAPHVPLWPPSGGLAWVPVLLVPVALFLLVAGLTTPNPTSVGQEKLLTGDREPVRGILRVTRNPFLWGVGLWAVAHMVPNGDLASLILFGTLALLALGGSVLIDAKLARRLGAAWEHYAARTSNLPFSAILAGRQSLVWREIGWWRPAVALLLYGGLLHLHRMLFGVSPLPW
ncbi:NnrU protein (plasmid) [Azospirillum argentinense]|uniref:NnrU protein n=1 Tax=Azospirillum argentinense TaxID=2970906 RepID=A0A4D8PWJ9_9PROT|nr:NnrU family protein [Azospirillum argentinense]QCN98991.1 NnrU protein [Azospirillum argentinense]